MKRNIGSVDKTVRIIVGLAIIALGLYFKSWWGLIGLLPVTTTLIGLCPLYLLLGINTCGACGQTAAVPEPSVEQQDVPDVGQQEGSDVGQQEGSDVGQQEGSDVGQQEGSDVGQQESSDVGQQEGSDVRQQDAPDVGQQDAPDEDQP